MDFNLPLVLFLLTSVSGVIFFIDVIVKRFFLKREGDKKTLEFASKNKNWGHKIWLAAVQLSRSLFWVFLIVFCVRSFVFEPFQIPSGSMRPTLKIGDFIVVNKLAYGIKLPLVHKRIVTWDKIDRGDVIVFNFPGE